MENKEEWMELCERAAYEPDPSKLLELVQKINYLLEEKRKRLAQTSPRDKLEETNEPTK